MRLRLFVIGLALPFALAAMSDRAEAITIFDETFDGYTEFPDEVPDNDEVNLGVPLISEGASENWFAARFGAPETDFDCDLAVQEHGGSGNNTPVGRFEDQAGLLFAVDTTGLTDVLLSFDWRTFAAPAGDQSVVGYFVGASPFPIVEPTLCQRRSTPTTGTARTSAATCRAWTPACSPSCCASTCTATSPTTSSRCPATWASCGWRSGTTAARTTTRSSTTCS